MISASLLQEKTCIPPYALFPIIQAANTCGLSPAAPPRRIGIVAPYTGWEIEPGKYCPGVVMPVTEE